ncbi:MAG: hypothetical protein H6732_00860 [Alphaproteobacteria bacterium]|nr:hypothetical protein [Alphaproteobacteria bacterium]
MRRLLLPTSLALLAGPARHAVAAEVTDLPPNLRADLHVAYGGLFDQAGLEEGDRTFGARDLVRHDVDLGLDFAVYTGLAVTIGVPITASQLIRFPAAREMLYEPASDTGSYQNGPAIDDPPEIRSGGSRGVWLGLAAAPFREDYARGLPLTSRLDLAFRIPLAGATLYGPGRGASPPGVGVRLGAAFSVVRGPANPYLRLAFTAELPGDIETVKPDGSTGPTLTLRDGHALDVGGGAELVVWQDPDQARRVAFDLHLGLGYRGPADTASGVFLPSVLERSTEVAVTRSEYLQLGGGLALDVETGRYLGFRLGADGWYHTPYRIEHPYAVRTDPQSFSVTWRLDLVGRIRLKGDRT